MFYARLLAQKLAVETKNKGNPLKGNEKDVNLLAENRITNS